MENNTPPTPSQERETVYVPEILRFALDDKCCRLLITEFTLFTNPLTMTAIIIA